MTPEDQAKLADYALAPDELPGHLAGQHVAAGAWLTERAGTAEAAGRVLLDPRVLGESPPRFGWMDVVMGLVALAAVTLVALVTLGVRAVVAPHKSEQVVLTMDVPAYHRLLLSDLAVQATPQVDGSFSAVELLEGLLTTHALKQGAVIRPSVVTSFKVPPGSAVVTVSVDAVPTGLRASQMVEVISPKGRATGHVLAQRPAKEGVALQLIVDSLNAGRVAGQKVSLIIPTQ